MRSTILNKSSLMFAIICFCVFSSTFLNADIVFLSDRDGKIPSFECDVYTMNDYGNDVRRLTTDLLYKAHPTWSPNGSQIVFSVEVIKPRQKEWGPGQTVELFLMNADGSNKRQITDYKHLSSRPTWSSDGRSIAFVSNYTGNAEIHMMDLGTGHVTQITNSLAESDGYASSPNWSPDGKKIVYTLSIRGAGRHIYIIDVNGKSARPLVKDQRQAIGITNFDTAPKWHPDNERILYRKASFRMEQKGNVQVLEIVGRGALSIRREGSHESRSLKIPEELYFRTGCWAEGGDAVIFTATDAEDPSGPTDVYRYDMFTHEVTNISNHPADDYSAHWINSTYSISTLEKLTTQWARLKKE